MSSKILKIEIYFTDLPKKILANSAFQNDYKNMFKSCLKMLLKLHLKSKYEIV